MPVKKTRNLFEGMWIFRLPTSGVSHLFRFAGVSHFTSVTHLMPGKLPGFSDADGCGQLAPLQLNAGLRFLK